MAKKKRWKRGISLFLALCLSGSACEAITAAENILAVKEASRERENSKLTITPKETENSKLTRTPRETESPKPTRTPRETESLKPARTPRETESLKPTRTPRETENPKSTRTPRETESPKPTKSSDDTQKPENTGTLNAEHISLSITPSATPVCTPTPTPLPEEKTAEEEEAELCAVIDEMTQGEGIQQLNTEYEPDSRLKVRLDTAILRIEEQGQKLSFLMLDLNSKAAFFYNPQESLFSASTIKGPYIACVTENALDAGEVEKDELLFVRSEYGESIGTGVMKVDSPDTQYTFEEMLSKTIQYSDDVGYAILRQRFGSEDFRKWLEEAGVDSSLADYMYPMYTVKELGKMWLHMNTYFQEGENGSWLSELYTRSESSVIRLQLGDEYEVFTKPGFNETPDGNPLSNALDDAGIINDEDNPYLLVLMTDGKGWDNASQSGDTSEVKANIRRLKNLAARLNELHEELVLWQKERGNKNEVSNGS